MFMLNSNEPTKVTHFQNCDRNGKQFFQWKSFDKARNVLIENKNRDIGSEKYILLAFTKYLSFPEVEKNSKVVNV